MSHSPLSPETSSFHGFPPPLENLLIINLGPSPTDLAVSSVRGELQQVLMVPANEESPRALGSGHNFSVDSIAR
jgi:hypothetical protein